MAQLGDGLLTEFVDVVGFMVVECVGPLTAKLGRTEGLGCEPAVPRIEAVEATFEDDPFELADGHLVRTERVVAVTLRVGREHHRCAP